MFTQNGLAVITANDYSHVAEENIEIHLINNYGWINCTGYGKMIFIDIQQNKHLISEPEK